jgi:hypothetical protein
LSSTIPDISRSNLQRIGSKAVRLFSENRGKIDRLILASKNSNPKSLHQAIQSDIFRDLIMGDEQVTPGLASIIQGMVRGVGAPLDGNLLLGQNDGIFHLVFGLRLEHENRLRRLGHKIRLVFEMIGASTIKYLELALGRFEPFDGIPVENHGKLSFSLRIKLLHRIEAAGKTIEESNYSA